MIMRIAGRDWRSGSIRTGRETRIKAAAAENCASSRRRSGPITTDAFVTKATSSIFQSQGHGVGSRRSPGRRLSFLRRNPRMRAECPRYRRGCKTDARACPTADASPPIIPAAILLPAGSVAARNRRRSSGRHCRACARRSPRRTWIHSCRSALPWHRAEDPCRNIRSSAEVAAPCWSRGGRGDYRKSTANIK